MDEKSGPQSESDSGLADRSGAPHVRKRMFVISDLHLGGRYPSEADVAGRGFRICTHVRELADFIRSVSDSAARDGVETELVINGDMVDFLAEESEFGDQPSGARATGWLPVIEDPLQAAEIFRRIIDRDKYFFVALRDLLASGLRLTLMLGNHDIELSFPLLRRMLVDELDADGKKFSFIYDGEAYRSGRVLIEHGNRYDEWNVVSYDALRRMRSVQSRLEPPLDEGRAFRAPPGSFLVAGVMNEIKSRYPFIDLLKPESEAAIPILIALAPEYRDRIIAIAGLIARSRRHRIGRDGLPSQAGDIADEGHSSAVYENGETIVRAILHSRLKADQLREFEAVAQLTEQSRSIDTLGDVAAEDSASFWATLRLLLARGSEPVAGRLPTLLTALQATRGDFSFDRGREAETYSSAAQRLLLRGSQIVLFGHTHLAKDLEFGSGRYINTGTWADLLPFPAIIFGTPISGEESNGSRAAALTRLAEFVEDMASARLQKYVRFMPTYARIEFDDRGEVITARLCDYDGCGDVV